MLSSLSPGRPSSEVHGREDAESGPRVPVFQPDTAVHVLKSRWTDGVQAPRQLR